MSPPQLIMFSRSYLNCRQDSRGLIRQSEHRRLQYQLCLPRAFDSFSDSFSTLIHTLQFLLLFLSISLILKLHISM